MNKLRSWKDEFLHAEYEWYQLKNGIQVLIKIHPGVARTDVVLSSAAGAFFEPIFEVPNGAAHLLEHILVNKADVKLSSQFNKAGNRRAPGFEQYGETSYDHLDLFTYGHRESLARMLGYVNKQLALLSTWIDESLEGEKSVIIREIENYDLGGTKYAFPFQKLSRFNYDIAGDSESVQNISAEHLSEFLNSMYLNPKLLLVISTNKALGEDEYQQIKQFEQLELVEERPSSADILKTAVNTPDHYSEKVDREQEIALLYFPVDKANALLSKIHLDIYSTAMEDEFLNAPSTIQNFWIDQVPLTNELGFTRITLKPKGNIGKVMEEFQRFNNEEFPRKIEEYEDTLMDIVGQYKSNIFFEKNTETIRNLLAKTHSLVQNIGKSGDHSSKLDLLSEISSRSIAQFHSNIFNISKSFSEIYSN